ncbi:hypothetical protein Ddc_18134 [Ditylenchus destructor]|nr:hypothetical protein Ddc_18134 [Ditylenchus destructor]
MASITLITSLFFVLAVLSVHARSPPEDEEGPLVGGPDGDIDGPPGMPDIDESGPVSEHPLDVDATLPDDSATEGEGSSSGGGDDGQPPTDVPPHARPHPRPSPE